MKALTIATALALGCAFAGPSLYFPPHIVSGTHAWVSCAAFALALYLMDSTDFVGFLAEARKNLVCWFTKGGGNNAAS
jgi:hypothetical protein